MENKEEIRNNEINQVSVNKESLEGKIPENLDDETHEDLRYGADQIQILRRT